jgi:hypothetical protein
MQRYHETNSYVMERPDLPGAVSTAALESMHAKTNSLYNQAQLIQLQTNNNIIQFLHFLYISSVYTTCQTFLKWFYLANFWLGLQIEQYLVHFQVTTTLTMKTTTCCVITPCSSEKNWRFGEIFRFSLHGLRVINARHQQLPHTFAGLLLDLLIIGVTSQKAVHLIPVCVYKFSVDFASSQH